MRGVAHLDREADLVVARILDEEPAGGGVDHPVAEDGEVLEVDVPLLEIEGAVGEERALQDPLALLVEGVVRRLEVDEAPLALGVGRGLEEVWANEVPVGRLALRLGSRTADHRVHHPVRHHHHHHHPTPETKMGAVPRLTGRPPRTGFVPPGATYALVRVISLFTAAGGGRASQAPEEEEAPLHELELALALRAADHDARPIPRFQQEKPILEDEAGGPLARELLPAGGAAAGGLAAHDGADFLDTWRPR